MGKRPGRLRNTNLLHKRILIMLKLKYQMGNSNINILGISENPYLKQLECENIRYFTLKDKITLENQPHFVLSQDKSAEFMKALDIHQKYQIPIIHVESNHPENYVGPNYQNIINMRAHINIFTNESLMYNWGFSPKDSTVIKLGYESDVINEGIIFAEDEVPVKEIVEGALPVVKKSMYFLSIFKEFENCFMFSSENEKKYVYAKISNMEKQDLLTIQNNAKNLMGELFPKESFVKSWKEIILGILR